MISYAPFFDFIKSKGISQYALVHKLNLANGTLYRIRKGKPISTVTIDQICGILKCKVDDVILYVEENKTAH